MSRFKLATLVVAGAALLCLGLVGPSGSQLINAVPLLTGLWLLLHSYRAVRDGRLTSAPSPTRFSLSTLLLLTLAAASVFGYAQWRRQWLTQQVKALEGTGTTVVKLSDSWFWPSVSSRAVVVFRQGNEGTYLIADQALNPDEAKRHYDSIRARLLAIGVEDVSCGMERVVRNNEVIIGTLNFNEPEK